MSQQQQLQKIPLYLQLEMPNCPKCGNTANVRLSGWTANHDRRMYKCKTCNNKWVYPKLEHRGTSTATLSERKQATERMNQNRVIHMSHLNIDLVVEIPCFITCQEKICDPTNCEYLDFYLLGRESIQKICKYCHKKFEGKLNSNNFCSSGHEILFHLKQARISLKYGAMYSDNRKALENEALGKLETEGINYEVETVKEKREKMKHASYGDD